MIATLRRIERENGRMMQAQIRLLREAWVALDTAARQRIIEGKQNIVDETVAFLHSLGTPQTPQRLAQGT